MDINSLCILWGGKQWRQYSQAEPEKSLRLVTEDNGDFNKWSRSFIKISDFSEFGECDKSLNHELGSI